jgi:hypothetical protein
VYVKDSFIKESLVHPQSTSCHGVDQMTALLVLMHAYPLVLMHAYPSAYAYRFDYVRLRCHLIMPTYLCLWLLTVAYDIYACLCMFVYLLMVYGISEEKIC